MFQRVRCVAFMAVCLVCLASAHAQESFPFDSPTMIALAAIRQDVQQELQLNPEEKSAVEKLFRKATVATEREAKANLTKKLAEIMPQSKLQRLKQIAWQLRPDEALQTATVVQQLELTAAQRSQIEMRWQESQEELVDSLRRTRFKSAEHRDAFIWNHIQDAGKDLIEILSEDQRTELKRLFGESFAHDAKPR